jgi:hypothetical protein
VWRGNQGVGATLAAEPTSDGRLDENAHKNCVAACVAAVLSWATGQPSYGDTVHDAVYGDGYIGGQDSAAYVNYLRGLGVKAIEYQSARGALLVANAKAELALGNPVLLTIPGFWTGSYAGRDMVHYAGGTHEVVACDAGSGWMTCMNPWPSDGLHAFYQRQSDVWWAARICYGREFTCQRVITEEQAEASQVAALQKRVVELQAQVAQLQGELKLDAPMRTLVQALRVLLAAA